MKEGSTVPRRGRISKRDVLPDPMYNSKLVTKLINNVMYDGKKGVAQKIVYDAFAIIEAKSGENALDVFQAGLENVMPVLEVKARRVGGSTYQVPMEVRAERRQTLGLRWLVAYSRNRGERTMAERLAAELIDAKNDELELDYVTGDCFVIKDTSDNKGKVNFVVYNENGEEITEFKNCVSVTVDGEEKYAIVTVVKIDTKKGEVVSYYKLH
jgi:small subunit ribosomal protein S7